MRIVLDVNVWISGLLWGGIPGKLLHLARNERISIFASQPLFLELETTLRRAKFQLRLELRGYTVESLMSVAEGFSERSVRPWRSRRVRSDSVVKQSYRLCDYFASLRCARNDIANK